MARRRIAFGRGLGFRQAQHPARQDKHGAGGGRFKGARMLYRVLGLPKTRVTRPDARDARSGGKALDYSCK